MELSSAIIKKYEKKTIPQLVKKAQHVFNAWIRKRDCVDGIFACISCDKIDRIESGHASHYMSAGNHQSLRFHEDNVHVSCVKCNTFLHGNLIEYRQRLIKKIGLEKVEWLEMYGKMPVKHDRYKLISIIEQYKNKTT